MRVNPWWFVLLLCAASPAASADELAAEDAAAMEVIEMLGEMDEEVADLDIAMSDVRISSIEKSAPQEVKNAE